MLSWIDALQEVWISWHSGLIPDLGIWTYIVLAVLVATEGPLSTLIGSAAAAAGMLDIRYVFIAAAIGNVVGDALWYYAGYAGKLDNVYRYGRWLGLRRSHLERLERGMHDHSIKLILFAKVAYGLIVPTLVAAGLARVPLRRWLPVVLIVETLWTMLIVTVGYQAAGAISSFESGMRTIGVGALVVFGLFLFWLIRRKLKNSDDDSDIAQPHLLPEQSRIQSAGPSDHALTSNTPYRLPLVQMDEPSPEKV